MRLTRSDFAKLPVPEQNNYLARYGGNFLPEKELPAPPVQDEAYDLAPPPEKSAYVVARVVCSVVAVAWVIYFFWLFLNFYPMAMLGFEFKVLWWVTFVAVVGGVIVGWFVFNALFDIADNTRRK